MLYQKHSFDMPNKLDFDFELGETIINQIVLLDKVLNELNVAKLNDNPDFIINRDSAGTFGLVFSVILQNKNTVSLWILLEVSGLRFDIDRISETLFWTNEDLKKSEREAVDFIKELFTSYILMEYSRSRTSISLFNSEGVRTKHYTLRRYPSLMGIFKKDY